MKYFLRNGKTEVIGDIPVQVIKPLSDLDDGASEHVSKYRVGQKNWTIFNSL